LNSVNRSTNEVLPFKEDQVKQLAAARTIADMLLLCFGFVVVITSAALPVLLLMVASRSSSKFFALSLLCVIGCAGWLAGHKVIRKIPFSWRPFSMGMLLAGVFLAASCLCAPSGRTSASSRLRSVWRDPPKSLRLSPAWLVDEADQVRLGGKLLPFVDPYTRHHQARRFSEAFDAEYRTMSHDSDFVEAGSVLGQAYSNMLLGTAPKGHCYIYHPQNSSTKRLPVIVFLHGWLGNMKAYAWSLSRFADEHGFVIVCPTFGNGIWSGPEAVQSVNWIRGIIESDPRCNSFEIYVVGLSNGGTGVVHWALTVPDFFRGLVFVSPVLSGTDSEQFTEAVGSRRILVVYGSDDTRIMQPYVEVGISRMRSAGLDVTGRCFEGEDHVLLLSAARKFQDELLEWKGNSSAN